jgi:hypothetical protein
MSRGLGKMEQALLATIQLHGKPMTFSDLRAVINSANDTEPSARLRPSFERSARRALHRLTSKFPQ